jgi:transcriptional regulator GlxA family with amidase domain
MITKQVGILVFDNCTASMVTGVMDILSLSNSLLSNTASRPLFAIDTISLTGQAVNSYSHFPLHASKSIKTRTKYDLLYIPGFIGDVDSVTKQNERLIKWIFKQAKENDTIVSAACNGNFLLAETGLLQNRKVTTHWNLVKQFEAKYKNIQLQPEKIIVDEGNIISAAGVTSYFNLALHIVQRFGSIDLSLACAKIFLVDSGRKIQTPYQMYQVAKNHGDEDIVRIQNWIESNFKESANLEMLSGISHITKKTLLRRFKKATGETPLVYLQKIRIENAKRLLESKNLSFTEVTWEVGYNDVSSFHKTFKAETGLTPIEYRQKFSII